VVVGATFLLGILRASCASQAPLVWVCRSFYGREPPAGAASRVARGGFTAFQLLISEGYGGEGKTASSNLRNLSWGAPNPPPVPLCARTRRQVHSNLIKATTHRINDSARSKSSLSGAFQESLQRSVRNEQPICGNFVATPTAIQSSNVADRSTPMTARSFTLARLRRRREASFNPRLPERGLAGDGRGCLITVEVEA